MLKMESRTDTVRCEIRNAIAVVSLHRPEKKNALSVEILKGLREVAVQLQHAPSVKAVILRGEGGVFSAGADIKDPERWNISPDDLNAQRLIGQLGPRVCREWEAIPQPTIAAIEGFAIGGAAGLALCCDFRVCSDSAFLHFPEVRIGFPMGWQTVPRLVSLCGAARTKQLLLFGDRIDSATALQLGLVTELAPAGQALCAATDLATRLIANPAHVNAMVKEAVNNAANLMAHAISLMDVDQINWSAIARP